MEEDEQAQPPEGDKEKPEPVPVAPPERCGRHPSQLLTGICSTCLMERLSSVRDQPEAEAEIVEVGAGAGASDPDEGGGGGSGPADRGRLRSTLMLLFQLDDSTDDSRGARPAEGFRPGSSGGGRGSGGKRRKGPGSWLRSMLLPKGWTRNGAGSVEEPSPPPPPRGGVAAAVDPSGASDGGGAQAERKPSFRRSCDWMAASRDRDRDRDHSRGSGLDPPRHSWDGSMVGRALACSFACLDEREDRDGAPRRVRRSNAAEEAAGDARRDVAVAAESRNGNGGHSDSADAVADDGRRLSLRGRNSCDAAMEMSVSGSGVGRRRSNRWSRVWDRSITSPLKEFVRKGEHVLERSLSESRREVRRGKNAEAAADISGEIQPGRNGHVPGRASQGAIRSSQAATNGDAQSFRTDWLKNSKIGRSRSVHYTSPGNLDNGMLRFYLTPMRSSRVANRGRRRSSRLFARGLFGFI